MEYKVKNVTKTVESKLTASGKCVFVPISDEILQDKGWQRSKLVPFNPAFLTTRQHSADHRPGNWISSTDFCEAYQRLQATHRHP